MSLEIVVINKYTYIICNIIECKKFGSDIDNLYSLKS